MAGENQGQNPAGNRKMMFLDAEPEISTRPAGSRTHRYQSSGLGNSGNSGLAGDLSRRILYSTYSTGVLCCTVSAILQLPCESYMVAPFSGVYLIFLFRLSADSETHLLF